MARSRASKFGGHVHEWIWPANTVSYQVCGICGQRRRDPNALHQHAWEQWGKDPRYQTCPDCHAVRRTPTDAQEAGQP